ncbi:hypothetical protein CCMA1212_006313 [Trichoderma ghanense]|uniref:Uncharacterized protein n=1 Tax=Trichoderma ghanense TaxID=65468 RepID=A0ABY2H1K0_9HYPO
MRNINAHVSLHAAVETRLDAEEADGDAETQRKFWRLDQQLEAAGFKSRQKQHRLVAVVCHKGLKPETIVKRWETKLVREGPQTAIVEDETRLAHGPGNEP